MNFLEKIKLRRRKAFGKSFKDLKKMEKENENRKHPTKLEYEKRVKDIQKRELESERFEVINKFVEEINNRKNCDLEKYLFTMIGSYSLNTDIYTKSFKEKREIRLKKLDKLIEFIESLTEEQIESNVYLKAANIFLKKSLKDCSAILEEIIGNVNALEVTEKSQQFDLNLDIPISSLEYLPVAVSTQAAVAYYRPEAYKTDYVNVLDNEHISIYNTYNHYTRTIAKIAEDIYLLQMWKLLNNFPAQVDFYHFSILNNDYQHQFRTSYFVKEYDKIDTLYFNDEAKQSLEKIFGIPFESLVEMDEKSLEKLLENKVKEFKESDEDSQLVLKKTIDHK